MSEDLEVTMEGPGAADQESLPFPVFSIKLQHSGNNL